MKHQMTNLKCPKGHSGSGVYRQNYPTMRGIFSFIECDRCNRAYFEMDCVKEDVDDTNVADIMNNGYTKYNFDQWKPADHIADVGKKVEYCECEFDRTIFTRRCATHPDQSCGKPDCRLEWHCVYCEKPIDTAKFIITETDYGTHFEPKKNIDKLIINDTKVDKESKISCQSECEHDWISYRDKTPSFGQEIEILNLETNEIYKKKYSHPVHMPIDYRVTDKLRWRPNCTNCTCIDKVIQAFESVMPAQHSGLKQVGKPIHEIMDLWHLLFNLKDKLKELKDK